MVLLTVLEGGPVQLSHRGAWRSRRGREWITSLRDNRIDLHAGPPMRRIRLGPHIQLDHGGRLGVGAFAAVCAP